MSRQYLSELLGDKYQSWVGRTVLLFSQTGSGKSFFIENKILPWQSQRKRDPLCRDGTLNRGKVKILCNRSLLCKQYEYSLMKKYYCYEDMKNDVEVDTYQNLAMQIRTAKNVDHLFDDYSVIILDESHFFYQDADFNSFGTFVLLHAIVRASLFKTLICMTATPKEFERIFLKVFYKEKKLYTCERGSLPSPYCDILRYDFTDQVDYSYVHCIALRNLDELSMTLSHDTGKSIVFLDSKRRAAELARQIKIDGKLSEKDVCCISADNIDDANMQPVLTPLVMQNKLVPKILITTSVLDNGVSVCDSEVKNLAVITDSRVAFIQMVGRFRCRTQSDHINLYLVPKNANEYNDRHNSLKKSVDFYENLKRDRRLPSDRKILYSMTDNSDPELVEEYRRFLITCGEKRDYLSSDDYRSVQDGEGPVKIVAGGYQMVFNDFAYQKVSDLYLQVTKFQGMALNDPLSVLREQVQWLSKSPDDLIVNDTSVMDEFKREFVKEALTKKNMDKDLIQEFKLYIHKKYKKLLFPDALTKSGEYSNDKLQGILDPFGLKLVKATVNGRQQYSIVMKE